MANYPQDAIPITVSATFSSMADRKPDRNFRSDTVFDTNIFTSEAGYERRTLRSRRSKRTYSLRYTNIRGIVREAIEQFYRARNGNTESFLFDLTHIGETGSIFVRFDGPLSIVEVKSGSSSVEETIYTISFNLQETFT
jgi:hypothetical protein